MRTLSIRGLGVAALAIALAGAGLPTAHAERQAAADPVDIQVLAFNDFHGNVLPPEDDKGGAAYLSTHLKQAQQDAENSVVVSVGDLIGGSPFISAAFYDEPTIEIANRMGVDLSTVGNHEFDAGREHLMRMQEGGCLEENEGNKKSCPLADVPFEGAQFPYLAANVTDDKTNETILPPYEIKEVDGVKVAFVGVVLEDTPSIVTADAVKGMTFHDEVEKANALVPELKDEGVEAAVAVVHQGGEMSDDGALTGPIVDITKGLDDTYGAVLSAHTHDLYVEEVDGRVVTQAASAGTDFVDLRMQIDPETKKFVPGSVSAEVKPVTHDVEPDADVQALIDDYQEALGPIASKEIGEVTGPVKHDRYAFGVSPLGRLIADAQLADPSSVVDGKKPQITFMNPGGVRVPELDADGNGKITFEEAFTAQPFGNYVVTMDMTGADIHDLLEQQWSGQNDGDASPRKILQTSSGFTYAVTGEDDPQLVEGSVQLNGEVIKRDDTTYRIATNNFLQGGGDNFPAFTKGKNPHYGQIDIDALIDYLGEHKPYTATNPGVPQIWEGVERFHGANRYETAAAVAGEFKANPKTVYVANGTDYPDALTGSAAAGKDESPVLLTKSGTLPRATRDALKDLGPQNIVVLGGGKAVSTKVLKQLQGLTDGKVTRVAGAHRYATGAKLAERYDAGSVDKVYVASGEDFPDALSAGAIAGAQDVPVLLTKSGTLPKETQEALQRLAPKEIVVMGGPKAINYEVAAQLGKIAKIKVTRINGQDRYSTATKLSGRAEDSSRVVLTSGEGFADALTAGPLAGRDGHPVLLTKADTLPRSTADRISAMRINALNLVGGPQVISESVADDARAAALANGTR